MNERLDKVARALQSIDRQLPVGHPARTIVECAFNDVGLGGIKKTIAVLEEPVESGDMAAAE